MGVATQIRQTVSSPELWRARDPRVLRWVLTLAATAFLADSGISLIARQDAGKTENLIAMVAFSAAALLCWISFDVLAIGFVAAMIVTAWVDGWFAGIVFVPAMLGVVAAASSGPFIVATSLAATAWAVSIRWLSPDDTVIITPLILALLAAVVIGASFRFRAVRHEIDRGRLDATREALEAQQWLEREAVEGVRRSVARDLHDVVAHGLTVIAMQSDVAVFTRDLDKAHDALGRISDASHQALTDLRIMLKLLQEPTDDGETPLGPPDASTLRLEITGPQFREVLEELGFRTTLDIGSRTSMLTRGAEITLHRVLQEATTNVLKHAPDGSSCAITIEVTGEAPQGVAALRVVSEMPRTSRPDRASTGDPRRVHLGLLSMRERVESLGGEFDAGRRGDQWVVEATIPVALRPDRSELDDEDDARRPPRSDAGESPSSHSPHVSGGAASGRSSASRAPRHGAPAPQHHVESDEAVVRNAAPAAPAEAAPSSSR